MGWMATAPVGTPVFVLASATRSSSLLRAAAWTYAATASRRAGVASVRVSWCSGASTT